MKLIKHTYSPSKSFPSFFDDFMTRDWFEGATKSTTGRPAANIREDENAFFVELAAPGLKKENFQIEVNDHVLTISAQVENQNKEGYSRKEFSYSSFSRSFTLPSEVVDEEAIKASYTDGVLHLEIPKVPEAQPQVRQIAVQ